MRFNNIMRNSKKDNRSLTLILLIAVTMLTLLACGYGYSQVDRNEASNTGVDKAAPGPDKKMIAEPAEISNAFKVGGSLMYVILALSIVAATFVIYFFLLLSPKSSMPDGLKEKIYQNITRGDVEQARKVCETQDCLLGRVVLGGLKNADLGNKKITEGMESAGSREASLLYQKLSYLMAIGVVAPMWGLLGTVVGMIQAFNAIAMSAESAKQMMLGDSIAKALITTAFGLIVAIPAFMFFYYFKNRIHKLITEVEIIAEDVSNAVVARGIRK